MPLEMEVVDDLAQDLHYTVIEITDLNRSFYTRTISKISDCLSSMYREDFRNEIMSLTGKVHS